VKVILPLPAIDVEAVVLAFGIVGSVGSLDTWEFIVATFICQVPSNEVYSNLTNALWIDVVLAAEAVQLRWA